MKVSIITPTWNTGRYLSACIGSVYHQSYKNIEYIIIDNLSEDETQIIVRRYMEKMPIVYIREKDSGQANAINKGLDIATGDIVCWLNADDYYLNGDVIQRVTDYFIRHREIDVFCGSGYYVDRHGTVLKPIKAPRLKLLRYCDEILQPATFWRRNNMRLKEKFHYVFDWIFFIEMQAKGYRFAVEDIPLAAYRKTGENKTALDNSSRRFEIYLVQQQFNGKSLNKWWCLFVYNVYVAIEDKKRLKNLFSKIVYLVYITSRGRIVS